MALLQLLWQIHSCSATAAVALTPIDAEWTDAIAMCGNRTALPFIMCFHSGQREKAYTLGPMPCTVSARSVHRSHAFLYV